MVVLDASVAVRWFVDQPGAEAAADWLTAFVDDPDLFVVPDLFRFEVFGALARLQPSREPGWAQRCFDRMGRLGIRAIPTDQTLLDRAFVLSRELRVAGYDAVYLAHAEALAIPWLTADERTLRRLAGDPRVAALS